MVNEQLLNTKKGLNYYPMPRGCVDRKKHDMDVQCNYTNSTSFNRSHLK